MGRGEEYATDGLPMPTASRLLTSRRLTEQAELLRVGRAMTGGLDPGTIVEAIARACVGVAGSDRCGIFFTTTTPDELEVGADEAVADWPAALTQRGQRLPLAASQTARTSISTRQSARLSIDAMALGDGERVMLETSGIRHLLMVPLLIGPDCLGLLALARHAGRAFTADHMRFGRELAAQVVPALHTARLLAESRRIANEQAALFRVSQALVSMHDLPTVLREITRETMTVLDGDCCTVELWHREADDLETVACHRSDGWPLAEPPPRRFALAGFCGLRFMLEAGAPLRMQADQAGLTENEVELLRHVGAQSSLLVPLVLAILA